MQRHFFILSAFGAPTRSEQADNNFAQVKTGKIRLGRALGKLNRINLGSRCMQVLTFGT